MGKGRRQMLLLDLLRSFDPKISVNKTQNVKITGVQEDSRRVRPGDLFIARPGTKNDGSQYINDAVTRGAAAVVASSI